MIGARFAARLRRAALPPDARERLAQFDGASGPLARRRAGRQPLAQARFVVLDLETTGPRSDRDRVLAIGAVAVLGGALAHHDAFSVVVRQSAASTPDNILVHRIGAQRQLSGDDPVSALLSWLEYRATSPAVAFRAEFDAAVLARELELVLGVRTPAPLLDLAALLPELYPGTLYDTLDAWSAHFGIEPIARHDAVGDAYATAQLLQVVLAAAQRRGARTVADLAALEHTHRWMGRFR